MSYIDLTSSAYSNLNKMAIYAQGTLTANSGVSILRNPIPVNGGFWAGNPIIESPPGPSPPAALQDPSKLYGVQSNSDFLGECANQLSTLFDAVDSLPYPQISFSGSDVNFLPGFYINTVPVEYSDKILTFDAQGDINAQFFLSSSSLTFTNTTFILQNGARAGNIFMFCNTGSNGSITFTQSGTTDMIVPCIIVTEIFTATNSSTSSALTFNGQIISNPSIILTNSGTSTFTINLTNAPYITLPTQPTFIDLTKSYSNLIKFSALALGVKEVNQRYCFSL